MDVVDRNLRNKRQEITKHAEYHGIRQNNIQSKDENFSLGKDVGNLMRERERVTVKFEIANGNKNNELPHTEHCAKQ